MKARKIHQFDEHKICPFCGKEEKENHLCWWDEDEGRYI